MEDKKKPSKKPQHSQIKQPLLAPAAEEKQEHTVTQQGSLNTLDVTLHYSNELLRRFLETLGLNFEELTTFISEQGEDPELFIQNLQQLFDHEKSCASGLKWATLDHLVEKYLQWPLLSKSDLAGDSKCCTARVKPTQRSVLLKSLSGLIKAYGVRGFVRGVEFTLSRTVRYFIYSMFTYRMISWYQTGRLEFQEFRQVFDKHTEKGVDTLVHELSQVEPLYLNLILSSPLILGGLHALNGMRGARSLEAEKIRALVSNVAQFSKSCFKSTFQEFVPPFSWFSTATKLQKIEKLVRWDGRISPEERLQLFDALRQTAQESHQLTQLYAMECLAKIAHGVGFKDLHKLKEAGHSAEVLRAVVYTKALALQTLSALTASNPDHPISALPRRLYATYLLWWLGFPTSTLKQKIPFSIFKAIKTALEISFLYEITESIVTAINCPDKPGYKFAEGFADWASDYTAECFNTRLTLFRSVDPNESFDELLAEIGRYHLADLTELTLQNLNASEFKQLLQSVRQKASAIETITAYGNRFSAFQTGTFYGLKQLKTLGCSPSALITLSNGDFDGLDGLQTLNLGINNLTALSNTPFRGLDQLQTLYLNHNKLADLPPNIFKELIHLRYLELENNEFTTLPDGVFDGLIELQTLELDNNQLNTLPAGIFSRLQNLYSLDLSHNQLTTLADPLFAGLTQLRRLYLQANPLTTYPLCVSQILNQLTGFGLDSSVITPEMFDRFTQLDTLALSGLTTVPTEITKLNQLQGLALQSNSFTSLPDGIFANFSQLRKLHLQKNQLIAFSAGAFQGLNQLERLNLFKNQLTYLPDDIFSHLSQLQWLSLAANQLTILSTGIFNGLNQLKELYLADNPLTTLPLDLFNQLRQLRFLHLGSNQLNDSAIFNLTQSFPYQLKTLNIDHNFISDSGLAALVKVLPCTHLTAFLITPSLLATNNTSLLQKAQRKLLEKVCSDRLCHANLPPAVSCTTNLDTAAGSPALLGNNNTWLPNGYSSIFGSNKTPLTLSGAASTQMTTVVSSAALIGSVGLGILLYKNCILLQSVVHTGWGFVQQCFYGKKEQQQVAPVESEEFSVHAANLGTQTRRSSICSVFATFFFKPKASIMPINANSEVRQLSIR